AGIIQRPPAAAVATECPPPTAEGLPKRAKKLRALHGARPHGSLGRQHRRGRELLPARGALFQNDERGAGGDLRDFAATGAALRPQCGDPRLNLSAPPLNRLILSAFLRYAF